MTPYLRSEIARVAMPPHGYFFETDGCLERYRTLLAWAQDKDEDAVLQCLRLSDLQRHRYLDAPERWLAGLKKMYDLLTEDDCGPKRTTTVKKKRTKRSQPGQPQGPGAD